MRKTILFQLAICSIIVIASCKRNHTTPKDQPPYPPLAEQRSSLASKPYVNPVRLLDSVQIISDLEFLASDACEGRKPGTVGHGKAVDHIAGRMRELGLDSFKSNLLQHFAGTSINGSNAGKNIVGWINGVNFPNKYIVISAHYDHLGKTAGGQTYYGADDNASGVACLLAIAKYFNQHPPSYSIIFAALDREETGLEGAYNFLDAPVSGNPVSSLVFNLNLDMIARSDNNEIFACGVYQHPFLATAINAVQLMTNVKLLMGHDELTSGLDDWTFLSDQGAFHEKGIPFLYVGVEDHDDYHQPSDTVDKINYSRYIENCNMILLLALHITP